MPALRRLMSQIILLPVLDRQISRYKRAFYFRDYDNFDVDQYVRDVDTVDLINVYIESIDIHEEAVNCMSILKNGNKNAHIKKKETIGLKDNNGMRDVSSFMNDAVYFILLSKVTTSSPFNSFFNYYFRGKGKVGYRKCGVKSSGKAR